MRKFYEMDWRPKGGILPEEIIINPSIGELYENVLKHYKGGMLCFAITDYTPLIQVGNLSRHFKKQRPNIFSKFFWHRSYVAVGYIWWLSLEGGDEQRKLFLQFLAKKYKNKYF